MKNTINLTVIDRAGKPHLLQAPTDMNMNIMEICKVYELPIEGICGGMALCASCQCYLESDTLLPEQSESELTMLDAAFHVKNNSRLGCQIHISEDLEGLRLEIAPEQ